MRNAAVGHQCEECVRVGAKTVRQPRTAFGGRQVKTTPVITYSLIAINVVMFFVQTCRRTCRANSCSDRQPSPTAICTDC